MKLIFIFKLIPENYGDIYDAVISFNMSMHRQNVNFSLKYRGK